MWRSPRIGPTLTALAVLIVFVVACVPFVLVAEVVAGGLPDRAFSAGPAELGAAVALFVLLAGVVVGFVLRHGRASRSGRSSVTPRSVPPDGVRPGELGTLLDARAGVLDVAATLVDLAVRGWVRIEDLGAGRSRDWRLVKVIPSPAGGLEPYEAVLYQAVFRSGHTVLLSEVRRDLVPDLNGVRGLLSQAVARRGWFRTDPSEVRRWWARAGLLLAGAGVVLTWVLARGSSFGLSGLAVVLAGLLTVAAAPAMPARTAAGAALLAQAKGFGLFLAAPGAGGIPDLATDADLDEDEDEDEVRVAEAQDLFRRYLPYAIVSGVADRWAQGFAGSAGAEREQAALAASMSELCAVIVGSATVSTLLPFVPGLPGRTRRPHIGTAPLPAGRSVANSGTRAGGGAW